MKKVNTSPISGMQELLPGKQAIFNELKTKIAEVYKKYGYLEIETPTIERTEILLAKAGGDTEKQIYKVVKTAETAKEADQALRFDHTVPLARYVVEHENDLVFPFKVSQIGLDFRGERAQKGRFREFYQCDIDVIGREKLPISYDADVIMTLIEALKAFNLKTPFLVRINNRKILTGLLVELGLEDKSRDIFSIVDHAEKIAPEKTKTNLEEIGLSEDNVKKILAFMNLKGERSFVVKNLSNLGIEDKTFIEGVNELDQVMGLIEGAGLKNEITADMKIVRGLDYYTGTVFEFVLPQYREIGSICGGGRYENLAGYFTEQKLPGVGGSIGLTRLFYVLNENDLFSEAEEVLIDYAIVPVSENEYEYAFKVADKLREKGNKVTVILLEKKLGDKITYAAKLAKRGVVVGEAEVSGGDLMEKDFRTGETIKLNVI